MSIRREDIDAGLTHPGLMLAQHYLKPLGITSYRLAKDTRVPLNRITAIVAGKRAITPDTALRLERYLGTRASFWINLQSHYDLETARRRNERRIFADITPRTA